MSIAKERKCNVLLLLNNSNKVQKLPPLLVCVGVGGGGFMIEIHCVPHAHEEVANCMDIFKNLHRGPRYNVKD